YSSENASNALPKLLPLTAYPDPMYNIPFTIVGPIELIAPPLAATLLTVSKSRAVLYSQITLPSAVESARSTPSDPPTNATPGIALTAAALFTRVPSLASGVYQAFSPVVSFSADMPPALSP